MHHHLPPLSGTVGAAFLLRAPVQTSATIQQNAGLVRLISGEPCLTVELHAAVTPDEVRDVCWRVAQEALDVHAATHREAYATRDGECNFITWQAESDGYALLLRPDEVLSRITHPAILEIANNALRGSVEHCHVLVGGLA